MSDLRRSVGCAWLLFLLACGGSGAASDPTEDAASSAGDGSSDAGESAAEPEDSGAREPDAGAESDDAAGPASGAGSAGSTDAAPPTDAAAQPDADTPSGAVDHAAALRSVEEQCARLRAQGLTGLDCIKAVATHMATLSDYAETGIDEASLTAFGVFRDPRCTRLSTGLT